MPRFTDERADHEQDSKFNDALDLLEVRQVETGGDCTALRWDGGTVYMLIVLPEGGIDPDSLGDAVIASTFEDETDDLIEERAWPTLRACFVDLYGNIKGETLPECLQD